MNNQLTAQESEKDSLGHSIYNDETYNTAKLNATQAYQLARNGILPLHTFDHNCVCPLQALENVQNRATHHHQGHGHTDFYVLDDWGKQIIESSTSHETSK